jgi:hypothetical protein
MNEETSTAEAQELRRDIAQTREELGETVEALVRKTDVKGQAKAKVHEKQQEAKAKVEEVKERPTAAIAIGTLAIGIAIVWVLRRR